MATSLDQATKFQNDLKKNDVGKTYLARVLGDFPCAVGEELTVEKSIYCTSAKLGKYDICHNEEEEKLGKTAKTIFKKLWYDEASNSSLLECKPYTGRTHQIRVHCYSLGYSIINDVNYGGVFVGNIYENRLREKLIAQGKLPEESINKKRKTDENQEKEEATNAPEEAKADDIEPKVIKKVKTDTEVSKEGEENVPAQKEEQVEVSKEAEKAPQEEEKVSTEKPEKTELKSEQKLINFADVNEEDQTFVMELWLHSSRYQYKEKVFECPDPYWTNKDLKFNIQNYRGAFNFGHK